MGAAVLIQVRKTLQSIFGKSLKMRNQLMRTGITANLDVQDGNYQLNFKGGSAKSSFALVADYSVGELWEKYGSVLWEPGDHKYRVSSFIGELDEIIATSHGRFSAFSDEMVDGIVAALRDRGNSNATINRKIAALSKLLRKAKKMGDLFELPEFTRQKERAGRIRFLDPDEERRLFAAINDRDETAFRLSVFLVDTGARLGEALGVTWNDVSPFHVSFWITKSGYSRTIPLTIRVQAALDLPRSSMPGPFASISQQRYRSIWNSAKESVGLGNDSQVVPHILRHTCASRLVQGGVDIRRVQMWLGHRNLQMTMRYAHLATSDLKACVEVLEGATENKKNTTTIIE